MQDFLVYHNTVQVDYHWDHLNLNYSLRPILCDIIDSVKYDNTQF